MNNSFEELTVVTRNKAQRAVKTLEKAFETYPLLKYYYPEKPIREKVTNYFLSFVVYSGIKYGEVFGTSPNFEGVVVWLPSQNYPLTFWKILRTVPISKIFNFGRYGGSKMTNFINHLDTVHKDMTPFKHLFLQTIGVAPKFQDKGFGKRLIQPMLQRLDDEKIPCYLETIDEKNVGFYQRFGFEIIGKSNIPETNFVNWAMLRTDKG
ncbi:MAG: GNAT family N-acetyltransferase [Candidatus Bathyarchaeota archaeon]|nr:GNAT family N-acetyltransferase [Candidatus Bathyarchaeum tardum]WGM89148.1 MAG: GNAT family N-acetyltransferase [Candidatus Bathyarchaeum tardum]